MTSPLVTVIMATYNHADYVAQTIRSVLDQRDVDFEFLIADDGSTDQTREVVASVQDQRIRFFPNTANRGACIVTNELIQQASGQFIALINSDDRWIDEHKLAHQLLFLRENQDIGACFGRVRFIDGNGAPIKSSELSFHDVFNQPNRSRGKWLRHFFTFGNCICHPTMLIRKECYDKVGMYNNRLRQLPDLEMWVRLVKHYDIHVFDKEYIQFRIIPGLNASSQNTTNAIRTLNEHYLIAENFFEDVDQVLLADGFGDILKNTDIPSVEHLNIEKALLYFAENNCQGLGLAYKMIGLIKLHMLFNDPTHSRILKESYGVDEKSFQKMTGEIDILRSRKYSVVSQLLFDVFNRCKRLFR